MYIFVVALHVVLCISLILIILLQPSKSGDVGSAFGGGMGSSVFGVRGPASLLQRATTVVAIMFMVTSITLAVYSNRQLLRESDVGDELQRLQVEKRSGVTSGDDDAPAEPATEEPIEGSGDQE